MREVGKLAYDSGKSNLVHKWEIDNFQYYFTRFPKECLMSPAFSTPHSNNAKQWRIRFYPQNSSKEFQNYSSVFLEYFGDSEVVASITFHISGRLFPPNPLESLLFSPKLTTYGYQNFCERTNFRLEKDTLTIMCEISFGLPSAIPQIIQSATNKSDLLEPSLSSDCLGDLDKLFETELLSDVTVTIGERKKSLHKAILANRSEVFRAMFEHDMIEKEKNVVDIVDIRLDVAMEMFRYIYTGRVNDIEKLAVDELLIAAEKYGISGLKSICEKTLGNDLNFDNALQYLTLASVHNAINLKTKAMDFIAKYLDKFVDKPQFQLLQDQRILCELLSAVARKKY